MSNLYNTANMLRHRRKYAGWVALLGSHGIALDANSFMSAHEVASKREAFLKRINSSDELLRSDITAQHIAALKSSLSEAISLVNESSSLLLMEADISLGVRLFNGDIAAAMLLKWPVDKLDFCFSSLDGESGCLVDLNFYDSKGQYKAQGVVSVTAWGKVQSYLKNTD